MDYESSNLPLEVSNPKRQATDTIRAYEYQIWQSVFRWITLKPNEILFLEKAEDFDVTSEAEAQTTQVKDTLRSGSVTLNSQSVVEALTNFWTHQRYNPNYSIRFTLLTTSARGLEQSNPFGGIKGLDYWDRCKGASADLTPLREFLAAKPSLPEDLRLFVSTASDDDLRTALIRRMEWATDQQDHEALQELIKRRVVAHGIEVYSLQPSESEKVISHLFTYVLRVIREDPDRRLDLSDFGRVFEENVTIRLTPQQLQSLKERAGSGLPAGDSQTASSEITGSVFESVEDLYDLSLLKQLVERSQLVPDLEVRLKHDGVLILKGSTGMGKSILAVLIAHKEYAKWKRLDFGNLAPYEIKQRLTTATLLDVEQAFEFNYIVDDLNFSDHPSTYERALGGFIQAVISRGGQVVVTTQGDLPTRLSLMLNLSETSFCQAPGFTNEEIKELATKHGCPSGRTLESWSRIIETTTGGHPQLVHARVKRIASDGWPRPELGHLLEDAGADQVRNEVRRNLPEYVPSEEARTLAYRLSVYIGPFKRSHALHLAEHPPAIKNAGEAFDFLSGPWIESYGRSYYKLSPLLKDSAQQMFDQRVVTNLHKTATYSFFVDGVLTQIEISGILMHGIVGQISEPLTRVAENTESLKDDQWVLIARDIDWFTLLATEAGTRLFESDPFASLILRRFQFRIAAALNNPEVATKVVIGWDQELLRFDEFKDRPSFIVPRLAFQQMFNLTFLRLEVPIPIRTIVRNIVTLIKLGQQWEAVANSDEVVREAIEIKKRLFEKLPKEEMALLSEELGSDTDKLVDLSDDVYFAAVRCRSAQDVSDFVDELEAQESDAADEIWEYLGVKEFTAIMLINGAWLSEVKATSPDWDKVLKVLDKVSAAALAKHADHLVAGAYRTKAIVLKEYANDKGDAFDAIREGVEKLGYEHSALQDYLAKMLMMDGRYTEAIRTWRAISPESENRRTTWRTFSHRDGVMCAGFLDDWSSAAEFALEGERVAQRLCSMGEVVAVGYKTEYAWALWKSGDYQRALDEFTEVINALSTLPDPNSDVMSYGLHMRVLLAVKWLTGNRSAGEVEPRLGIFSDPSQPEVTRERDLARQAFYVLIGAQLEMLKLKYSLRSLRLDSLIAQYAHFSRLSKALHDSQKTFLPVSEFGARMILNLVFAALVNWIGRDKVGELPIETWKEDAKANGILEEHLAQYFTFLQEVLKLDEHYLRAALDDLDKSSDEKLAASLLLSNHGALTPEDRFIANLFLVTSGNAYAMWREETENIVAELIGRTWMTVVKEQRSSLLAPLTNVTRIVSAIEDSSSSGIAKAARILLAVRQAVKVRLQNHTIDRLTELAQ